MTDHADQMNEIIRRAAGRGRFTVDEAAPSAGSVAMNALLRGEKSPAPEPEADPEPWHSADAAEGRGQSLPRREPSMDDLIRGDHRAGRRERQEEAETARAEREHGRGHRSY